MDPGQIFRVVLSIFAIFVAPGWLLTEVLLREPVTNPIERLGLSVGTSLAVIPVTVLYISPLGLRLNATSIKISVLVVAGLAFASMMRHVMRARPVRIETASWLLALILGATLVTRFAPIQNLDIPMWGDSYQHSLITQLIQDNGKLPENYLPYAELERFTYHFGFHTNAAFLAWVGGIPSYTAVLVAGQFINATIVLAAFVFGYALWGDQRIGLLSALLAGLVFVMPAYFINWGRYPQLMGLIILPVAFSLVKRFIEHKATSSSLCVLAGLVCAGLCLTHYAVAIFFGLLLGCYVSLCANMV